MENPDIEAAVIGCLFIAADMDTGARAILVCEQRHVNEDWFSQERWRKLWVIIQDIWKESRIVDTMLTMSRYGEGAARECTLAVESAGTSTHLEYYIEKLKEMRLARMMRKLCGDIYARAGTPNGAIVYVDQLSDGVRALQGFVEETNSGLRHVSDIREEVMTEIKTLSEERFVKKNRRFYIGLPLPWDFLNEKYMGMKPGLHIIAALPSQGKTTMGVAISLFWCQQGIRHGFVCIDMTAKELVKRYATLSEQVSLAKMNWGGSPEDVRRFEEGMSRPELENVEITESYRLEAIRNEAYNGVMNHGWQAIIIDYLQLVQDDFRGKTATYEQVKQVTQGIKQISKDLNVPIVCLVQLARAFAKENRDTNRKPGLDDLGDSAEIARAASTVAVLVGDNKVRKYWDDLPPMGLAFGGYYKDPETGAVTTFNGQAYLAARLRPVWYYMIKNQQGPIGEVPFVMYPNYFMFRPGDPEAPADESKDENGKVHRSDHLKFETLRDDWLRLESDVILEKNGTMGYRGIRFESEGGAQ